MVFGDVGWAILAAGALALGFSVAIRVFQGGRDAFAGYDLGPGDIDAGLYLASGRIAWRLPAAHAKGQGASLCRPKRAADRYARV